MNNLENLKRELPELEKKLKKYREVLLANLVMIGEIPCPTFGERERSEFILHRFDEAGLTDSSIDDAGDGIGILSGKEPNPAMMTNATGAANEPPTTDPPKPLP